MSETLIKEYHGVYRNHSLRAVFPSKIQAEAFGRVIKAHDDDIEIVAYAAIEHPRDAAGHFGGLVFTKGEG